VGQDEAGTGKPHQVEPGEEGREDHQVSSANSKLGRQAQGVIKPAKEVDIEE
jgi:hypothetical protein